MFSDGSKGISIGVPVMVLVEDKVSYRHRLGWPGDMPASLRDLTKAHGASSPMHNACSTAPALA